MKSIFVFLALVALSQGVPLARNIDERIINGEDAKLGEIPFQVSLHMKYNETFYFHYCGGSIINKNYVITAAHCTTLEAASSINVIAGTIDLENLQSIHEVSEIIIHSEYDDTHSWTGDIALLKVKVPFEFSETISYVPLPERGAHVPSGAIAVTSGWGSTVFQGPVSEKLQRTDVLIASQEYCNRVNSAEGYPVYGSQICAYNPAVETGPCHGDSGGPLTVNGKLVGITSWVIKCGSSKNPTVYTRVTEYLDWIEAHVV